MCHKDWVQSSPSLHMFATFWSYCWRATTKICVWASFLQLFATPNVLFCSLFQWGQYDWDLLAEHTSVPSTICVFVALFHVWIRHDWSFVYWSCCTFKLNIDLRLERLVMWSDEKRTSLWCFIFPLIRWASRLDQMLMFSVTALLWCTRLTEIREKPLCYQATSSTRQAPGQVSLLPWTKKKNHPRDSWQEEHCSILWYHAWSRAISAGQGHSRLSATFALRWSRVVEHDNTKSNSNLLVANLGDGSFFLSRWSFNPWQHSANDMVIFEIGINSWRKNMI